MTLRPTRPDPRPARRTRRRPGVLVPAVVLGTALAAGASTLSPAAASTAPGPARSRATAPSTPASPDEVTGVLTRLAVDAVATRTTPADGAVLAFVDTGRSRVQVPSGDVAAVPTGALVRVRLGGTVRATGTSPSRQAAAGRRVRAVTVLTTAAPDASAPRAASAPRTAPTAASRTAPRTAASATPHSVTMVLVVPAGGVRDAMTTTAFRAWLESTAGPFWSTQSEGAVSFSVADTRTWVTSSVGCTSSQGLSLFSDVARQIGFTTGAGKHLALYIAPSSGTAACPAGLGTIGSGVTSGGALYVHGTVQSLLSHELGHNLSLGHSNALRCPAAQDGTWTAATSSWSNSCATASYGDQYDVMGVSWSSTGSLSTVHAARLGLLGSGRLTTTTTSRRVVLKPVAGHAGLVCLKVNDPAGVTYVVEYRAATGADAFLAGNAKGVQAGVVVRRVDPASSGGTVLLDATPTPGGDYAVALTPGTTLTTASGRVRITAEAQTATDATVAVRIDGVELPSSTVTTTVDRPADGTLREHAVQASRRPARIPGS